MFFLAFFFVFAGNLQQSPPPPRTGVESPPVGQTLGSGEPPEGRLLITKRPFKKNIRHCGAKHRRRAYSEQTPLGKKERQRI